MSQHRTDGDQPIRWNENQAIGNSQCDEQNSDIQISKFSPAHDKNCQNIARNSKTQN